MLFGHSGEDVGMSGVTCSENVAPDERTFLKGADKVVEVRLVSSLSMRCITVRATTVSSSRSRSRALFEARMKTMLCAYTSSGVANRSRTTMRMSNSR